MAVYFLDSSALVKRYLNEAGSSWLSGLFAPNLNHDFFIAIVASVEVISAVTRRSRGGGISTTDAIAVCTQFKSDLQLDYQIVEITESVIDSAIVLAETHGLRGYDAIQLAAGCEVNKLCIANGLPAITFVCADNMLNAAALNEGLVVENPNNYP
jgi:uncharacterized protein